MKKAIVAVALIASLGALAGAQGLNARVSVSSLGVQGTLGSGGLSALSTDGRFVAFHSSASNLTTGDTNGKTDVFVRDRFLATTTRQSLSWIGAQANNHCYLDGATPDGRYVVFESAATNLVAGDTNQKWDVFVRDTLMSTTIRVTVATGGLQANGDSFGGAISADGRFVTFRSAAFNLVTGDSNGAVDVFLRDLQTGVTTRVNVDSVGAEANGATSSAPSISGDGRYIAFESSANNLVAGDYNNASDIFVRDTMANITVRASSTSAGLEANGNSFNPRISSSGRYVVYSSSASNLTVPDLNARDDVFRKDLLTGAVARVSVTSTGGEANDRSDHPSISSDGRYVAFDSVATNLDGTDSNGVSDAFIRDMDYMYTLRVSVDAAGLGADSVSELPGISGDGHHLSFSSFATNLVPLDTNLVGDVFAHDLFPGVTTQSGAHLGATIAYDLHSPDEPGAAYVAAMSIGYLPGTPIDSRCVPLNQDLLFAISLGNTVPPFTGFVGTLDMAGLATATLTLPYEPALLGYPIAFAWVTLDPAWPTHVRGISNAIVLPIAP